MSEPNRPNPIGELIKNKLQQRGLSLRKFSELTAVDTATISRIINGKRKATPEHLQQFAACLQVPAAELFHAAGYAVEPRLTDLQTSVADIQSLLANANLGTQTYSTSNMEQELSKYELFSQTDEGQAMILKKFDKKLSKAGSTGPYIQFLKDMYAKYRLNKGTWERALIGSALIYFIIPTDLIPDYIFPLGYIDDAIAVNHVAQKLHLKNPSFFS